MLNFVYDTLGRTEFVGRCFNDADVRRIGSLRLFFKDDPENFRRTLEARDFSYAAYPKEFMFNEM